jgi:hypothetical protein
MAEKPLSDLLTLAGCSPHFQDVSRSDILVQLELPLDMQAASRHWFADRRRLNRA